MKPLLKNTKENCNREEKQEEDNKLDVIKFFQVYDIINFFLKFQKIKI